MYGYATYLILPCRFPQKIKYIMISGTGLKHRELKVEEGHYGLADQRYKEFWHISGIHGYDSSSNVDRNLGDAGSMSRS